jgi:hypothetical protein
MDTPDCPEVIGSQYGRLGPVFVRRHGGPAHRPVSSGELGVRRASSHAVDRAHSDNDGRWVAEAQ